MAIDFLAKIREHRPLMTENRVKVHFASLGCPKNLVDSEVMLGHLVKQGYRVEANPINSHVLVVNTCGFIEASKKESIDTILELAAYKKKDPDKLLVVTGCLSQRYSTELEALLPEVDLFMGTGELDRLPKLLAAKRGNQSPSPDLSATLSPTGGEGRVRGKISYLSLPGFVQNENSPRLHTGRALHSRYIKIAEGCSHSCSFCVIPMMRGGLKSRSPSSIVQEMQIGLEQGVKEFNYVSQDLNEYGRDLPDRHSLTQLLEQTQSWDGEFWIRLLYLYPLHFPDKLVRLMAEHPHLCRYVDIPLQHIDDEILKSMRRGSSSRYIRRLLANLRAAVPELAIRTTFIVGYPGETDDQFKRLIDFVAETEFDRIGVFTYSDEEGTHAATLPQSVPTPIREERRNTLMQLQQTISRKRNARFQGKTVRAIYEGPSEESDYLGQARFDGQAPEIDGMIYINDSERSNLDPGSFVDVRITETHDYDLVGTIL